MKCYLIVSFPLADAEVNVIKSTVQLHFMSIKTKVNNCFIILSQKASAAVDYFANYVRLEHEFANTFSKLALNGTSNFTASL